MPRMVRYARSPDGNTAILATCERATEVRLMSISEARTTDRHTVVMAMRTVASRDFAYNGPGRIAKRAMDVAIVLGALPICIPLMLLIVVAIKLDSPGAAIFRQTRVGRHGREFSMVKFRTMVADAEDRLRADSQLWESYVAHDHKLPAHLDARLTRIGRSLRRTSLDELPQLWNVLTGRMSIVGPRPVTPEQLADWDDRSAAYLTMRPGLTGLWQINGRSGIKADDRVAYDAEYLNRWSIGLDLKILALTPVAVVTRRGAH